MSSSEPDELYTLRNLFWLGNYQMAINEANGLTRCPAHLVSERDEYLYRSYLSLGQSSIINSEIKDSPSTSVALKAIKVLSSYIANPSTSEDAQETLVGWMNDSSPKGPSTTATLQTISAIIYMLEENNKDAIKTLKSPANLEQRALLVQLYLRIDRPDIAQKELKVMKSLDEESCLSMLATAWVNLALGGAKVQEAAYIYDELVDKYGGSSILLNGLAVSKMHQEQFEEAETLLQEALTKSPQDPNTLANLISVSQHLQRAPEIVSRHLSQLRLTSPNHPLITALGVFEGAFDRVAISLQV